MSKFVVGALSDGIYEALHKAGVFADEPSSVARVIIDLKAGSPAMVYVQRYADDSLTEVLMSAGVEIIQREQHQPVECDGSPHCKAPVHVHGCFSEGRF